MTDRNADQKTGQPHPPENQSDEDAIAFAQGIFELARKGGSTMLSPLLDAGVPVDIRTSDGDSLLLLASANGHTETVQLLLVKGADPELTNRLQQTPLMVAALNNHGGVIDRLLGAGASPDTQDAKGQTALDLAHAHGAQAAIDLLNG